MKYKLTAFLIVSLMIASSIVLTSPNARTGFGMDTDLTDVNAFFYGEYSNDRSGYSISGAGDVNGDGYDDILIGAYSNDEGGISAGQTYLILGKASRWSIWNTNLSRIADASFIGATARENSGSSISGAGDVNGDGFDDILIGAPGNHEGGIFAGQTYLIFGKASGWKMDQNLSTADASFIGEAREDYSGRSVSGAGDVNGDGYDDILIGAPYNDSKAPNAGQTYLIFGKASGWVMDQNLSTADASYQGEAAYDNSGYSVSGAGDVNGDGYDDILIGAPSSDEGGGKSGHTYLILGRYSGWFMNKSLSSSDWSFIGEDADDLSGISVSGAGDVNRDGYDDILIGANGSADGGTNAGQTYLIFGEPFRFLSYRSSMDLSKADASFIGEDTSDRSGWSVSGAGDVNGDGADDILIGAWGDDDGGTNAGQTYLILGKSYGWSMDRDLSTADASFIGRNVDDDSGYSVSGAGDVNGDGYHDILIGAPGGSGSERGATYLIFYDTKPPAPKDVNYDLSADGDQIRISWKIADYMMNITGYNIYRSLDGSSYHMIAQIDQTTLSYTDTDVMIGNMYYYKIQSRSIRSLVSYYSPSIAVMNDPDPDGDNLGNSYDLDDDGDMIPDQLDRDPLSPDRILQTKQDIDIGSWGVGFIGEDADDHSGRSVSNAGDVNGDGYDDILIGAMEDDDGGTDAGQTYLILGKSSGWSIDQDLSNVDASFWGEHTVDYSANSVSGAGDVNGDGYDDILIAAYGNDEAALGTGQTYLIFGKASGWAMDTDLSTADASFLGESSGDYAGWSVSTAGDVNGDGYDDILIGAYGDDDGGSDAGITYLILGRATWRWYMDTDLEYADASFIGEDADDNSGWSVSGAGDVNGDGYDDILIGAHMDDDGGTNAGQTYLILGKASGWAKDTDLSNASASFWGEENSDQSGKSVSGAGDVNRDGYDDILIGASGNDDGGAGSDAGQTYLIFGKASGWAMDTNLSNSDASFWGENAVDNSGCSVSDAGDVNGDGYDDILIGAWGDDDGGGLAGKTYLILGKDSGWHMDTDLSNADLSFIGEDNGDQSGCSVSGAGDVNGDGYDDILIGAKYDDDGGLQAGRTYLFTRADLPPVENIDLNLTKAGPGVYIKWDAVIDDPFFYNILRGSDDSSLYRIGTTTNSFFIDENVEAGLQYYYTVVACDPFGGESQITETVRIVANIDTDGDGIEDLIDEDDDGDGILDRFDRNPLVPDGMSWTKQDVDLENWGIGFIGENSADEAGFSVSDAGDVNGDGYDDILIGAHYNDDGGSSAGQTYLILGKASGWNMTDLSDADASFIGEDASDRSGRSVSGAGDVNGDGYDDILIGAWEDDDGGTTAGQTYLIFGKASGWSMDTDLSTVDASFWGENAYDRSGYSVSGTGDVNGDGYDDILISAHLNNAGHTQNGQTYLIFGKASGWSMDTDLSDADASFIGEYHQDYSGESLSGAGDVNGDGYDDILIGAWANDEGGSAVGQTYLILGKTSGWSMDTDLSDADASFWGVDTNAYSGRSVSDAGDVNGDGYDDILIGAYGNNDGGTDAGKSYLILGKASGWSNDTSLSDADASFIGEEDWDNSGRSVSGAGDVNNDGYDDILIGAYTNAEGGSYSGQTYMFFGKASGWANDTSLSNADAFFIGNRADRSGYSVSSAGDVNGDGYDDILIGAYSNDEGGNDAGMTYLIINADLSPVQNITVNLTKTGPGIYLKWNDIIDDPYFYGIYRGSDDGSFYRIASTTDPYFVDWNVTIGLEYHYAVVACGPLGEESQITETARIIADMDTDGDGMGNLVDWDDDGDGVADHSDAFPLNFKETLDTDGDGIGNAADHDDDNDGVPDATDTWPLSPLNDIEYTLDNMNSTNINLDLDYLNSTLDEILSRINLARGDISALSEDMYEMEGNITGNLDDLEASLISEIDGLNSTLQAELAQVLTDIFDRMDDMDTSIRGLVEGMWENYNSTSTSDRDLIISTLGNMLDDMDQSLSGGMSEVIDTIVESEGNLTTAISDLQAYLDGKMDLNQEELLDKMDTVWSGLNKSLITTEIAIKDLITLRMDQLELYISLTNSTIHYHLDSIQNDIEDLKTEFTADLDDISLYLDDLWMNKTEENVQILEAIKSTNELIISLNSASMTELRGSLLEIRSGLIDLNDSIAQCKIDLLTELIDRIDGVNRSIDERLDEVENALAALEDLDAITDDIEMVSRELKDTRKEVEDAGSSGNLFNIILIVLLLVTIGVLVFLVMKSVNKKDENKKQA